MNHCFNLMVARKTIGILTESEPITIVDQFKFKSIDSLKEFITDNMIDNNFFGVVIILLFVLQK